jgi:hypothetical protein
MNRELIWFVNDIGAHFSKEEIIAVVQSYYLKYPGLFKKSLKNVPRIVDRLWDGNFCSTDSKRYTLALVLLNHSWHEYSPQTQKQMAYFKKYD